MLVFLFVFKIYVLLPVVQLIIFSSYVRYELATAFLYQSDVAFALHYFICTYLLYMYSLLKLNNDDDDYYYYC